MSKYGKLTTPRKLGRACSSVFKPDTNTVLAFNETSAATSAALGCQEIEVVATNPCCIEFGASPTATTSSMYLPAGRPERFMVEPECKVAAIAHNAWTPAELDDKLLWLRAADLVGTVDDGAEVLTWSDKSGNGFDATGAEGSAPTLDVDGFNGHPTLAFDGTEYLTTADLSASGDFTIFAVANSQRLSANEPVFSATDLYYPFLLMRIGSAAYYSFGWRDGALNTDAMKSTAIASASSTDSLISVISDDGEYNRIAKNGVVTTGTDLYNGAETYNQLYIGRFGANYLTGDISEILIFNSALSDADREKVEGYLAHDYGLESELLEDHTYATVQPLFGGNIHIKKLTEVGAIY